MSCRYATMHITSSDASVKSQVCASVFKIKSIYWHRCYFSQLRAPITEHFWVFCWQLFSHACTIDAQMLLSRNRILIVKSEHIPSGSNTAETKDRTILWVIFAGNSCSVPRQTMRLSVSTFQLSPRIEDDCGSASKVFTTFVDLSVSGICDLTSSSLVIHFVNLNPPLLKISLTFW